MRAAIAAVLLLGVAPLTACPPPATAPTRLATGTTPNAVATLRCADGPRLLVAASAEGRLEVLDPEGGAPPRSVFLGAGSAPWDVAVWRHGDDDDDDARAIVTLSGTDAVALVAPCGGAPTLLQTLVDEALVTLPEPIALREPDDVDGDGSLELEVTRLRPRTPQAVVVAGGQVLVAWANVLAFATGPDAPMLTGPGLVSRVAVDAVGDRLVPAGRAVLPCENPGGLAVIDDDTVAVSCAGRFAVGAAGHEKASAGGLARLAVSSMTVTASSSASTPGPLLFADGLILSGDLLDGALHRHAASDLAPTASVGGRADVIDSAFALAVDVDGVPVAGWFDGRVTRDPFGAALTTPAPSGPTRGLIDLASDGTRLWGLHSLSAELVVVPEAP